ncbi:cytochrome P450 [Actinacidiphila sp. DG2A-62]|uniref:cytochrome P450 n=1 Tax=Actinacidiphila sp. DG2A-62 TaxID=3108821 RepID=UPI002DB56AF9|nr:cytochrome P450 [Actinacidiphila sp. DG2A-62]MEC3997206.1 cytochrome P450 [Actinacidiphila sp. DG2A-62]
MPVLPVPSSDVDLFCDATLRDPYPAYHVLREKGPAVYLPAHQVWAVARHEVAERVLHDDAFASADGIALTDLANHTVLAGTVLASDGQAHRRLRRVLSAQLAPRAVQLLTADITARAERIVTAHLNNAAEADGVVDAVAVAAEMVTGTVMDLMGLPKTTLPQLQAGAPATFDLFGPANPRYQAALPIAARMVEFLHTTVTRERVRPDSWMGAIFAAVDTGRLVETDAIPLASAYTAASMDTTVLGLADTIGQLARHPTAWARLRTAPTAWATPAFDESLRLEAPIQGFGRRATTDVDLDGVRIRAGDQVWVLYGAAGRDPRRWGPTADAYDPARPNPGGHLAFGTGPHLCAGIPLARLQAHAVLTALARHAHHLDPAGPGERLLNHTLRGYRTLPVRARPAPPGRTAPADATPPPQTAGPAPATAQDTL